MSQREFDLYKLVDLVRRTRFPDIILPERSLIKFCDYGRSIAECSYMTFPETERELYILRARDILKSRNLRNFRVLVGAIAHELCHLIYHRRNEPFPHNEKELDDIVIQRGLGKYLMEAKGYIHEWNPEFVFRGHTAEEIANKLS